MPVFEKHITSKKVWSEEDQPRLATVYSPISRVHLNHL